ETTIAGKPVSCVFTSAAGLRPFVKAVLEGEDYPLVYPGIYRPERLVDIGAHAGAATVYLKAHYPEMQVACFEPCKDSFANLGVNTRELEHVKLHNRALADETGHAQLFSGQYSSMQHSLKPNAENTDEFEWVSVLGAEEALEALGWDHISLLKIDTEGCEIEILTAIADRLPQIDVIYLEYHSEGDRLALDALLAPHFVLYAARAHEPHRGTNTYVRREVFETCSKALQALYVHPK
ncbi:MAG TPA: FkbM family methyltransferase, partial [Planctomycetota bacterium]|nr:FkbM family methyltransferase [Planctomycetota bacterium]